jgi:hypothetical protein
MLGEIPCDHDSATADSSTSSLPITFEHLFRQQWAHRLAKFDDVVSQIHSQEKLFEEVLVCGNLFAICKKLENLLRTSSGLSENIKQVHEEEEEKKLTLSTPTPVTIASVPGAGTPIDPPFLSPPREAMPSAAPAAAVKLTEVEPIAQRVKGNENDVTQLETGRLDDDGDDDDDELLPGSNDIFTKEQQQRQIQSLPKELKSNSTTISIRKASRTQPPQGRGRRVLNSSLKKSQSLAIQSSSNDQQGTGTQQRKITDVFHNIADLFPAVQTLFRKIQKSGYVPSFPRLAPPSSLSPSHVSHLFISVELNQEIMKRLHEL